MAATTAGAAARADMTATVESRDGARVAGLLLADATPARRANNGRRPSSDQGRRRSFRRADDARHPRKRRGVRLDFRGQVTPPKPAPRPRADLELRAGDGTRFAALAGLAPPLRLDGVPISGKAQACLGGWHDRHRQARPARSAAARWEDRSHLSPAARPAPHRGKPRCRRGQRGQAARRPCSISALRWRASPRLPSRAARARGPTSPSAPRRWMASRGSIRLNAQRLTFAEGIALEGAKLDIALGAGKVEVEGDLGHRPRRAVQGKAADREGSRRRGSARRT